MARKKSKAKNQKTYGKFKPSYLGGVSHPFKKPTSSKIKLEKTIKSVDGHHVATAKNDADEVLFIATASSAQQAAERLDAKIAKGHTVAVEKLLKSKKEKAASPPSETSKSITLAAASSAKNETGSKGLLFPKELSRVSDEKLRELYGDLIEIEDEVLALQIEQEYVRRFPISFDETSAHRDVSLVQQDQSDTNISDYFDTANVKIRKRQQHFRAMLLQVYGVQCMVTGTTITEILEAAHIKPLSSSPDNNPDNGLVLRADIHKLFDNNLLRITDEYDIELAASIQATEYAHLKGKKVVSKTGMLPSRSNLRTRYRAGEM